MSAQGAQLARRWQQLLKGAVPLGQTGASIPLGDLSLDPYSCGKGRSWASERPRADVSAAPENCCKPGTGPPPAQGYLERIAAKRNFNPAQKLLCGVGRAQSSSSHQGVGCWYLHQHFSSASGHQAQGRQQDEQQRQEDLVPSVPAAGRDEVWNTPNLLSLSRAVSGPVLWYQICQDMWVPAISLLVIAGITDWADGYLARKQGLTSALGSYLDPLADKLLIGCVAGALAHKALIPVWVAAVVIGRDVSLVSGMFLLRARRVGWRWPGAAEFFKVEGSAAVGSAAIPAAQHMRPSLISKLNTVVQLAFVGCCITQAWYGWPDASALSGLEALVVGTTIVSGLGYVRGAVVPKS